MRYAVCVAEEGYMSDPVLQLWLARSAINAAGQVRQTTDTA